MGGTRRLFRPFGGVMFWPKEILDRCSGAMQERRPSLSRTVGEKIAGQLGRVLADGAGILFAVDGCCLSSQLLR